MNKTNIYIYNSVNDFLKQLDYLNKEYNNITNFYKYIPSKSELVNQIAYLKKVKILCFTCFYSEMVIKITFMNNKQSKYVVSYKFSNRTYLYNTMRRFLKEKEIK